MSKLLKLALQLGLVNPIGFHTYWSAPKGGRLRFDAAELVSLVAGPIFWRHLCGASQFWLFTDKVGFDHLNELGILPLYDRIEFLEVDKEIQPQVFWAAAKLYAYRKVPLPAVSMDFDAFVTRPFWRWRSLADVVALNEEPLEWECYRDNHKHFGWLARGGLYESSIQSTVPVNAGVLGFFDERLRDLYTADSIDFMRSFSELKLSAKPYVDYAKSGGSCYFEEMVFAEQRLLPVVAKFFKKSLRTIAKFNLKLDHIYPNTYASHLWNAKSMYQWNHSLRENFVQRTVGRIQEVACDRCYPVLSNLPGFPFRRVMNVHTGETVYLTPEAAKASRALEVE